MTIQIAKRYRHFKGGIYEVLALASHSETLEDMVVYRHTESGRCWVRPASMWNDTVSHNGQTVCRFTLLETEMNGDG